MVDDSSRQRVIAIASQLVEGMIEQGVIPCTEEAIRSAMPQAVADARAAVAAAEEFLCG